LPIRTSAAEAKQPPLSDLRTLAGASRSSREGGRLRPAAAPRRSSSRRRRRPLPVAPKIYTGGETGVVAPVIVTQALPPFRRTGHHSAQRQAGNRDRREWRGRVRGDAGVGLPDLRRDGAERDAGWRYRPATANGTP